MTAGLTVSGSTPYSRYVRGRVGRANTRPGHQTLTTQSVWSGLNGYDVTTHTLGKHRLVLEHPRLSVGKHTHTHCGDFPQIQHEYWETDRRHLPGTFLIVSAPGPSSFILPHVALSSVHLKNIRRWFTEESPRAPSAEKHNYWRPDRTGPDRCFTRMINNGAEILNVPTVR